MARYSLGKNTGTTDKSTSSRSTPIAGEDLTFNASIGEVPKIKQPRIQVQKWQGDTYISNPSPTLAPQLDLPDLSNVLAEPNRDFAGLADALSGLNTELKNFGTVQTKYEGVMQKAARDEADAIIKQTSVEGTASQKLANLNAELERIIKDENSSKEEVAYAKATQERIRTDSRLAPAIESAYREEEVLTNAAGLSTAAETATIKGLDKSGDEIDIPVNTLSPDDERYISWANDYIFNDATRKLSSFEYKNVKGQLAQYLANDRAAQAKRFNKHQNNEYVNNFNYETNKIGEDLRDGFITKEQAIFKLEALLERGRIGLVSESTRKELQENLVENVIVAYMKNNKNGNVNDLSDMFGSIMTGPVESRVIPKENKITITTQEQAERYGANIGDVIIDKYAVRNDKQLWINQFPAGYLEARISDANTKLALNDESKQSVINGIEETNSIALFKKEVFPLLAGEISNIPIALVKLGELRNEAIKAADGDAAKIDAINKAYDKRENTLFGIFSVDYNQDVDGLDEAARAALRDPKKIPIFAQKLYLFEEKWSGYNKADTYLREKAKNYVRLYEKLTTAQLKPIQGVLSAAKDYYINTIGREERGKYNTLDEEAQWSLIEENIMNHYISGIDLNWSATELNNYNKEFVARFTKDNKKQFIKDYMPDVFQQDEEVKTMIKPTFEGTVAESLNIWEKQALKTGELNSSGLLNNNGRDRIRILYESKTPLFSVDSLDSVIKQLKNKGTIDRRLKVIVNNLPADAQGKLGTFLLHEYKKHGIILNEAQEKEILSLNDKKMAQNKTINNTFNTFASTSSFFQPSVLIASTNLSGVFQDMPPLPPISEETDPLKKPDTLKNLISEMNGAYQFRGASNPNYRKGDYRSNKKGNWFFDFRPELINAAGERIQTLTEQDLNAMTLGALLEAGTTDLEKFEVGANLLIRSVAANNAPIAEILAAPNQYEAIFNPMGRVKGLTPYTVEELNATPNFVKLGLLLQVSPKRARTLYYFHRNQFASQIKSEG
tara:strand:+ start:4051 stop:7089 length:3039 start_codon:yes stop_codon:yes gene_type:complete